MQTGDVTNAAYRSSVAGVPTAVALVFVLTAGAILESVKLTSLQSSEIWVHLRTGSWILENETWPRVGLFTQANNGAWRDLNWGYDVVAAGIYRLWGLCAIPVLLMLFRMALAVVAFLLAGGRRGNFWVAVVISITAQFALSGMGPVAAFSSVILFGGELLLFMECRSSSRPHWLYALPPIFAVWANLDIGFVYGIGLMVLFVAILGFERLGDVGGWQWLEKPAAPISMQRAAIACGAALVGTLANPYGYHPYPTFWAIQASSVNRIIPDYRAMGFHRSQDYVVLLLTMTAFLVLGLRRSRDLFQFGALIASALLSFRFQSEAWVVTLVALAVIGGGNVRTREGATASRRPVAGQETVAIAGLVAVVVLLTIAYGLPCQRKVLLAKVGENFPVRACDSIRNQQLPQPLFNSYAWGNFLTWYLPEYPVAIDGRRGLYPDETETDYFKVINAEIPYQSFAPMKQARTLLLDKVSPMGEALRDLPGFRVKYEDNLSLVLVHELPQ